MDISVLASVGSFVMSERVLKPKASVLVLLGCLLAYDLTSKTHDVSSLRVYRGTFIYIYIYMINIYLVVDAMSTVELNSYVRTSFF